MQRASLTEVATEDRGKATTAADIINALPPRLAGALRGADDAQLFLVGGFVRDRLLGRVNHDVDVAVQGDVAGAARRIGRRAGGTVVPLDPGRGTYRVVLRQPERGIAAVDLTALRGPTIAEDLAARDFTMNAIAVPLDGSGPRLVDPTGGLSDLSRRLVRMTSPTAFQDDPARLLRAVRFAVQLEFGVDAETAARIQREAGLLAGVSAERSRDEFMKILGTNVAATGVRLLDSFALLSALLPELDAGRGVEQPPEHYFDVFQHNVNTVAVLDLMLQAEPPPSQRDSALWRALWERLSVAPGLRAWLETSMVEDRPRHAVLKLAGLLHDVGKPETKTIEPDTGRIRFFGHDALGSKLAAAIAQRLRLSVREREYLALLAAEHMRPGMLAAPGEAPTGRALFRFFRDLGDAVPDLLLLNLADHAAASGPRLTIEDWTAHVDYVAWLLRTLYEDETVVRPPRLLSGDDLMRELDLSPGPAIGRLLAAIEEAQAAGEVMSREQALELARAVL